MSDYFVELVPFEGLPKPTKRVRIKNPGSRPYTGPRVGTRDNSNPASRDNEAIPGQRDWQSLRFAQTVSQFFNHPGFPSNSKAGIGHGMTKAKSLELWEVARERARQDMQIIKAVFPTTDEIAEEATMHLLTALRGPADDNLKMTAAVKLLEFYKAKPSSKSNVTVTNTFENWVSSLEDDVQVLEDRSKDDPA